MADLVQMIAIHVSNDFDMQTDETNANGNIDHKTYVRNCISTYSSSTLTNVRKLQPEGQEPNITVKCCMLRSELSQIYEKRIEKARDMVGIADEALEKAKVDMALQYYYWAYSLIRSLQHPTEAKDAKGHSLVTTLPVKIRGILEDISVTYEKKEGDFVDLLFTYKGRPVSGLDFTYSDGRESCDGMAKDGRGMLEMAPGYETDFYHIDIEYEYKNLARGDDELEAVLNVVRKTVFPQSSISVKGGASKSTAMASANSRKVMQQQAIQSMSVAVTSSSQTIDDDILYGQAMERVLAAIQSRNYAKAASCFTLEGLEVYNKLISYGTGRVVGNPQIVYYRSMGGQVVARGLQMSFSFPNGKRKKTFVEDVVFTFNPGHKICNVAFGLGDVAEADILHKDAPGWKNETKELIMEFLENYKTESILVYIAMQAVQIIISVIPGQAFQFAAGILWGFFLGLLFSLIGAFVGTTISFYLAKLLGRDAMHLLFTEEKMNWFVEKLNSRKAYTIVFLIYLIPGLPKDIMSYAAGISSMNFKAFLIFSMIGRTPAMSGSLLIGALYFSGHYGMMIAIGVFAVAAFVLCIVFRKKISNYIDKLYEKVTED